MIVLNRHQQEAKKLLDERTSELAIKKGITYLEAKRMIESNQKDLSDFKFK